MQRRVVQQHSVTGADALVRRLVQPYHPGAGRNYDEVVFPYARALGEQGLFLR